MPELPDLVVYVERLSALVCGQAIDDVRLWSPFVLRTVEPPLEALRGRPVEAVRRLGKRIVLCFPEDLFLVIHLMIAGRLHWREQGRGRGRAKTELAAFELPGGTLLLTEAGTKKRASLHVVHGAGDLAALDRGGVEVLECSAAAFTAALRRESRTLKRALVDPRLFSGIGNAYSDEILHRAKLSPMRLTRQLDAAEVKRLRGAARAVLSEWIERLRAEAGVFPEKVTAFRRGMSVHGRFGQPCPVCESAVQRIIHGDRETNYCPRCQTGGRILADRSLSRLLGDDWPASIEELE